MTKTQKKLRELRERQSKERGRMAELGLIENRSEEQSAEFDRLEAGIPDLERDLRQAMREVEQEEAEQRERATAGEPDAEARELRELRSRVRLGNYVSAAMEMRAVAGAEAEFNQALEMGADRFPLHLLAGAEERATTDTDTATRPRRWIDRLFAGTAAASVGVTMESVEPGVSSHPVTTAGASAAQRGRTEAVADAAWTIGVTEIKPTRNAVRAVFTLEDAARIPGLEDALQRDLRMALTEGIDRAIFLGDDGANEATADITGLTTAAGLTEKTITQANKVKGSSVLKAFAELIDGKAAMAPSDLRTVLAVGANTLWSHTLANTGASVDTTIAEFLRRFGLSWVTRGEIETATDANDFGGFVGLARGIEGAAVAAVWDSGQLIRDPYGGAAKGEVALTLNYLWGFALPRASNFVRVKFVA